MKLKVNDALQYIVNISFSRYQISRKKILIENVFKM